MNFVYEKGGLFPLDAAKLTRIANAASFLAPFTELDFKGDDSRVNQLTCHCNGCGEFELIDQQPNEFRRFVRCRICNTRAAL